MNSTSARVAIAALVLVPASALAAPSNPVALGHSRAVPFRVIQKYVDGPWLVPTLKAMRSANDWNLQMAKWVANQEVVGAENPPAVDWSHEAVVVLSLGKQIGNAAVTVNRCTVEADMTVLELHFDTPTQWDPYGDAMHPAVLVAVDRADLKNLEIRCDAVVDGLPPGDNRRDNGAGLNVSGATTADTGNGVVVSTGGESATAGFKMDTTWGRVKDQYHR